MAERGAVSPVLREALRAWLPAAFEVLTGRDVPGVHDFEVTVHEGVTQGRDVVVPDYFMFALRKSEALGDLAQTEAVLEVVRADPELRAVLLADRSEAARQLEAEKSWLVSERLVPFIAAVLARDGGVDRTDVAAVDALFTPVYDQFEESIYRFEAIPVTWLVQFANLGLQVDDFDLAPGVRLRRPTEREKILATQAMFGSHRSQPSRLSAMFTNPAKAMDNPDRFEMPDVFLEVADHRHLPRSHLSGAAAVKQGERMLTALRLVNDAAVGIHSIWYIDENPFDSFPMPRRLWHDPIRSDNVAAQYVVTPDVERQVRELWPHLAEEPTDRGLSLALRRLNDSYHRARAEDRLIDYWVGLEALFGKGGEHRHSISLRLAKFIGAPTENKWEIYTKAKKSYDVRSRVAHGEEPDDREIEAKANTAQEYLRRALVRYLVTGVSPDPEEIDKLMLGQVSA